MAIVDYRLDPFLGAFNIKAISNEQHTIPTKSPYTVRMNEVPQKTEPTTLQVKFSGGAALTEVAAQPAQGQFWPDYNTTEHGVADWNTGTLLFNAADAGKEVLVSYNGLGTMVDDRLLDMAELDVTSSTQPERSATVSAVSSYDSTTTSGSGNVVSSYGLIKTHKGLAAGTYTARRLFQNLINLTHSHEYVKGTLYTKCDCDCGDDSGGG